MAAPKKGDTTTVLGQTLTFDGKNWVSASTASPQERAGRGAEAAEGALALPGLLGDLLMKGAMGASPFQRVTAPTSEMPGGKVAGISSAGPDNRTPAYAGGEGITNTLMGLLTLGATNTLTPATAIATTAGGMAAPQAGAAIQRSGGGTGEQLVGEIATDLTVTGIARSPVRAYQAAQGYRDMVRAGTKRGQAAALRSELQLGRQATDTASKDLMNAVRTKHKAEHDFAKAAYARVPDVKGGARIGVGPEVLDVAESLMRTESPDLIPDVVKRVAAWETKEGGVNFSDVLREIKSINALTGRQHEIAKHLLPQLETLMDDLATKSPEVGEAFGKWKEAQKAWARYRSRFPEESATTKMLIDQAIETPDNVMARVFNSRDPKTEARVLFSATAGNPRARETLRAAYAKFLFGTDNKSAQSAITRFESTKDAARLLYGKRATAQLESVLNKAKPKGLSAGSLGQGSLMGGVLAQAAGLPWYAGALGGSGLELSARILGPSRSRKIALAALYDKRVMEMLERRVRPQEGPQFVSELLDVAARAGFNSLKSDGEQQ